MTKRLMRVAAAAALLMPAFAFAQSQVEVVNGERGMIFKDTPSTVTREQVRAELKSAKALGDAHWRYVGGEAVWAHNSHVFKFDNGRLVHASDCPYLATLNAPKAPPGGDPVYTGA